jgi:hypothetical protein
MGRWLELDSLDNQNIASALLVGSYTAAADIDVYCTLYAQGLAGGGDYIYYVTVTPSGLSEGEGLKTTQTLGATTYVLFAQSIPVSLRNGDVMKVYLDGLAGDTAAPDVRVNFYESPSIQPTTAGNKLDVAATGEAGLDFSNIKAAANPTTLTNITVPVVTTLTNANPSTSAINTALSTAHGSGLWSGAGGTGATSTVVTVNDGINPIDGVEVWVTTDPGGANIVASGNTDVLGQVTFMLDPATYYVWKQHGGYTFTNPQTMVVT